MEDNENKLSIFLEEIKNWNSKINLVSKNDLSLLKTRHLEDSLKAVPYIPEDSAVADIGSGNGFPVIPLAIMKPTCYFNAFEVRTKRAIFLENVVRKTGLKNITVHCEKISNKYNGTANGAMDIIISRAFKDNLAFVENSFQLLKTKGMVVCYNSLSNKEIEQIEKKISVKIENVDNYVYNLGDGIKRTISRFFIHKEVFSCTNFDNKPIF